MDDVAKFLLRHYVESIAEKYMTFELTKDEEEEHKESFGKIVQNHYIRKISKGWKKSQYCVTVKGLFYYLINFHKAEQEELVLSNISEEDKLFKEKLWEVLNTISKEY